MALAAKAIDIGGQHASVKLRSGCRRRKLALAGTQKETPKDEYACVVH